MAKKQNKKPSEKRDKGFVWKDTHWSVRWGRLVGSAGHPGKVKSLLSRTGEKIPYEALADTKALLKKNGAKKEGVYVAHDSMGYPRDHQTVAGIHRGRSADAGLRDWTSSTL